MWSHFSCSEFIGRWSSFQVTAMFTDVIFSSRQVTELTEVRERILRSRNDALEKSSRDLEAEVQRLSEIELQWLEGARYGQEVRNATFFVLLSTHCSCSRPPTVSSRPHLMYDVPWRRSYLFVGVVLLVVMNSDAGMKCASRHAGENSGMVCSTPPRHKITDPSVCRGKSRVALLKEVLSACGITVPICDHCRSTYNSVIIVRCSSLRVLSSL